MSKMDEENEDHEINEGNVEEPFGIDDKAISITNLPPEIRAKIFELLPQKEKGSLRQVNHKLADEVKENVGIIATLCLRRPGQLLPPKFCVVKDFIATSKWSGFKIDGLFPELKLENFILRPGCLKSVNLTGKSIISQEAAIHILDYFTNIRHFQWGGCVVGGIPTGGIQMTKFPRLENFCLNSMHINNHDNNERGKWTASTQTALLERMHAPQLRALCLHLYSGAELAQKERLSKEVVQFLQRCPKLEVANIVLKTTNIVLLAPVNEVVVGEGIVVKEEGNQTELIIPPRRELNLKSLTFQGNFGFAPMIQFLTENRFPFLKKLMISSCSIPWRKGIDAILPQLSLLTEFICQISTRDDIDLSVIGSCPLLERLQFHNTDINLDNPNGGSPMITSMGSGNEIIEQGKKLKILIIENYQLSRHVLSMITTSSQLIYFGYVARIEPASAFSFKEFQLLLRRRTLEGIVMNLQSIRRNEEEENSIRRFFVGHTLLDISGKEPPWYIHSLLFGHANARDVIFKQTL